MVTLRAHRNGQRWVAPAIGFCALAVLVLAWHLWVRIQNVNQIQMPEPMEVVKEFRTSPRIYLDALGSTMATGLTGLLLGTLMGSGLAIFCWASRIANGLVSMSVLIVRSVPIIILIPVISRVLGFDVRTTVTIVTLISFFPAFVLVSTGLRELPPSAEDLASVLGASRWQKLRRLAVPAAAPKLAAAVRMSAGNAILAAMVTEFLVGSPGLGYVFLLARAELSSEAAWAAALVGAVGAVLLFGLASWIERRIEDRMRLG